MSKKLFGTDGIRGIANKYPMTGDVLFRISKIAGKKLSSGGSRRRYAFIGKDTRLSCDMLETSIASGLMSEGIDVYRLGVIPTPALAYLTRKKRALFGVMISASHNPFYDNGIKFIGTDGFKLPDAVEIEIEKDFSESLYNDPAPLTHRSIGRMHEKYNYADDYIEHVCSSAAGVDFSGLRVLVDCANGATSGIITELLQNLGIRHQLIDNNPTGDNINNECGSTNLDKIARIVKDEDFDCGIAFDGDGDRCLMVDENGNVIDGDMMMAIYFQARVKNDPGFNGKLVATVMSNMGLKEVVRRNEGEFIETPVGDKYVLEKMIETGAIIGGEQSGHIIFLESNTTGDGVVSAVEMLKLRAESGKSFSEMLAETGFRKFPQVLYNVKVKTKEKLWELPGLNEEIESFRQEFCETGRILIRPSGTEPFVRVMAEAVELEKAEIYLRKIIEIIEKNLG